MVFLYLYLKERTAIDLLKRTTIYTDIFRFHSWYWFLIYLSANLKFQLTEYKTRNKTHHEIKIRDSNKNAKKSKTRAYTVVLY